MFRKSFKNKVIVPTVVVLVILVVALNVFLSVKFSALSDDLIDAKLAADINSLKSYLHECKANSKTAAVTMAFNNTAIRAIKNRDTAMLLDLFTPTQDMYRINFFTICDKDGIVLARTHEPDHFGDSILGQQNVLDALHGKVSTYFEEGTAVKVSVRTGAPIYDTDGKTLIGVVSTGTRFDTDAEVEKLKNIFKAEVTVFMGDTRISTTITRGGERIIGTTLDPKAVEVVINNKQEYTEDADILGARYKKFYLPLLNSKNESFATIVLAIPEADIITTLNQLNRSGIIFGFVGLVIAITLLFVIISSISKPITQLSDDMNRIANGDLNIKINASGKDEIGQLSQSVQKVADIVRKLLKDVNDMISEQTKGNTDYSFDTTDFSGAYKTLAENVLELVTISTNDPLTGLPNKHNFNNRLDWEWSRAKKENTPISVLMMEIDELESYNNKFGQQQGDVCLRTVAKFIKQCKRQADFAARWSGEKFIILLPAADSNAALSIAETIRGAVEKASVPCADAQGRKVTVSIGASTKIPAEDAQISDLVSLADVSLYQAKDGGKNRVVMCQLGFEEK